MVPINYFAVVLSAALGMGIGYGWYYKLFARQYEAYLEITPEKKAAVQARIQESPKMYWGMQILAALLTAFVLAHFTIFTAGYLQIPGMWAGILSAVFAWLGFAAPIILSSVIWEGKEWQLWLINAGYYLVSLFVMGLVLGFWS
jgi:hypothetical protein